MGKTAKIVILCVVALVAVMIVGSVVVKKHDAQTLVASTQWPAGFTGGYQESLNDKTASFDALKTVPMQSSKRVISTETATAGMGYDAVPKDENAATTPRLVIKTGQITLLVKNVPEAVQKIVSYANSHGGFVVSNELTKTGVAPYASITIRIPVAVYDSGFSDVKALGEVQSENSTGQDVTDQYVDLGSRLKNLQASEAQLLAIMKRATKISDVLDVQEQLTDVHGQIEVIQGQMKYLSQSASMSSLTIYVSTDPSVLPIVKEDVDTWKPFAEIKNAVRGLIEIAKTVSYGVIWFVVYIPLWLLIILAVWIIVKLAKRFLKNRHQTQI